jgi:hypothetical protein
VIPHEDTIRSIASIHGLDPLLLAALQAQETGGDCFRPKLEPQIPDARLWFPREWSSKRRITHETECALQRMSWGPLQILGSTARWMGFDGDIPELCDPVNGILYAAKYLKWLSQRPSVLDESHMIAAYNGGAGIGKTPGGMFVNQSYVDSVSRFLRDFRKT